MKKKKKSGLKKKRKSVFAGDIASLAGSLQSFVSLALIELPVGMSLYCQSPQEHLFHMF